MWAYKPVPAEFFRSLKRCTQIETLWIGSDDAKRFAALAALPDLPTLDAINIYRILNIMNTRVTDAGLVHLLQREVAQQSGRRWNRCHVGRNRRA